MIFFGGYRSGTWYTYLAWDSTFNFSQLILYQAFTSSLSKSVNWCQMNEGPIIFKFEYLLNKQPPALHVHVIKVTNFLFDFTHLWDHSNFKWWQSSSDTLPVY